MNKNLTLSIFGILLFSSMLLAIPMEAQQHVLVNINGLTNAVDVGNTNALTYLQNNINALTQKDRNTLNKLGNLTTIAVYPTNNTVVVQGKTTENFLGLKFLHFQREVQYNVGTAGIFSRVPNFWDFLWKPELNMTQSP